RGRPRRSRGTRAEWNRWLDGAAGDDGAGQQAMIDLLGIMLMSTKTAAFPGRSSAFTVARSRLLGVLAVLGMAFGASAHAENVLENISHTALPGGKVELTLRFSDPV